MEHHTVLYDRLKFGRRERSPDSYSTSELHTIDGKGIACLIAVAVEIENPWHHAREFGGQITSTIIREFARSQSASNLIRFEQALKSTNHVIKQAHEKLGVGINCTVALLIKEEIHFAVVGRASLLLFRNGRLTDVVPNEEKGGSQFSSVTSGDLEQGEWIMLGNQAFTTFLRQLDTEIWQEKDVEATSAAIIEAVGPKEHDYTGALLRYLAEGSPREHTVLWDTLEPVTPIKLPKVTIPAINFSSLFSEIRSRFSTSSRYVAEKSQVAGRMVWAWVQRVREARRASAKVSLGAEPKHKKAFSLKLSGLRWRWQYGALIAFIVLLGFGVQTLVARVKAPQNEPAVATLIDELRGIPVGVREQWLTTDFSFDRYESLQEGQKEEFAQLIGAEGIETLSPSPLVSQLPAMIVALDVYGSSAAAIDDTGQMWLVENGQAVKVEQSLLISGPLSLAAFDRDKIVASDNAGNLWLFDNSPSQPLPIPLPSTIATGAKIVERYSGNLYVYDPGSGAVYRQTNFSRELSSLSTVIADSEITEPLLKDMAVNGEIITLGASGGVTAYSRGKATGTTFAKPMGEVMRLASVESNDLMYLFSTPLLYVVNAGDGVTAQTLLPLHKNSIRDLALSEDGTALWLVLNNEIYRTTL